MSTIEAIIDALWAPADPLPHDGRSLPDDTEVFAWRCPQCKQIVEEPSLGSPPCAVDWRKELHMPRLRAQAERIIEIVNSEEQA